MNKKIRRTSLATAIILTSVILVSLLSHFNIGLKYDPVLIASKNNDSEIDAQLIERNNLILKRIEDKKLILKQVHDKFCNISDIKLAVECLEELRALDANLSAELAQISSDPCSQCVYRNGRVEEKSIAYHHTFFHIKDNLQKPAFERLMRLNIMSFLGTQNLCCSRLIVWLLKKFDLSINKRLEKSFDVYIKKQNLEFRTFSIKELCAVDQNNKSLYKSSFSRHPICQQKDEIQLDGKYLVALSDFIRFFVLDLYGGVWVDGDVIFLKDMRLLWSSNFAYRWSFTHYYNTAVMGLNKYTNSHTRVIIDHVFKFTHSLEQLIDTFHPIKFSSMLNGMLSKPQDGKTFEFEPFMRSYHSLLFDPAWLCNDGVRARLEADAVCHFTEFYGANSTSVMEKIRDNNTIAQVFFPGAFAYHMHYKGSPPVANSFFEKFEKYFSSKLTIIS